MNLQTLKDRFLELSKTIEAAKAEMAAEARRLIQGAANDMFDAAPEIETVFWTQYTPYFSDGEACYFIVNDIYFTLIMDSELDDIYDEGSYLYTQEDYEKAKTDLATAIEYSADPEAWKKAYLDTYYKENERTYPGNTLWLKPYPYDPEEAKSMVTEIELQMTVLSPEDVTRIQTAFDTFCSMLAAVPEDIMQTVYGDHARITITKQGTTTDEYDHD